MKKGLKKSNFIMASILATSLFVTSVSAAVLKAETAPNFKIIIDGVLQNFKDANGNKVEPVVINGVTYLPLRSVADAFGKDVSWDGSTSTISIGETGPLRLIDVTSAGANYKGLDVVTRNFSKVSGENSLTFSHIGDVGAKFKTAIKVTEVNTATKEGVYELKGAYKSLSCTLLYIPASDKANDGTTIRITNNDTGIDVLNQTLEPNKLVQINDVDITGLKKMLISAKATTIQGKDGTLYILDPIVK